MLLSMVVVSVATVRVAVRCRRSSCPMQSQRHAGERIGDGVAGAGGGDAGDAVVRVLRRGLPGCSSSVLPVAAVGQRGQAVAAVGLAHLDGVGGAGLRRGQQQVGAVGALQHGRRDAGIAARRN